MHPLGVLTAGEVCRIVDGELRGDHRVTAHRFVVDTRGGLRTGDCFVALRGERSDGIAHIGAARAAGCTMALAARAPLSQRLDVPEGKALVLVDDPLSALQRLAAESRRRFAGPVVAITGSNGKTTVKDMLVACLATSFRVSQSPASYNSQLGVALSLLWIDAAADLAVIECGISLPGEMDRLHTMVRPDHGVFVNVGDAHLEGLGSRENIASEKARLFRDIRPPRWVVVGGGQPLAVDSLLAVGLDRASLVEVDDAADCLLGGETRKVEHLARDARIAAAAARRLGCAETDIARALGEWRPAQMRFEIGTSPRGVLLINDAWTSDPVSLDAALRALSDERQSGRSIAVLGGMAQLGGASRAAHEAAGRRVAELGIDVLIGVGAGGGEIARAARAAAMPAAAIHAVDDVEAAAALVDEMARPGDRVLLKASRPERFERISEAMFDALAPTRLYVDLDSVVANYRTIRDRAGTPVMAVIKSFGYGLDAVRLARVLERAGVENFAVAYPDEGVYLREHSVTAPILVQNVLPAEALKTVRAALTAAVWTTEQIDALQAATTALGQKCRVHIKMDTGMNRAGIRPEALTPFLARISEASGLVIDGVFTHLAGADDADHDSFSARQLARFDEALAILAAHGVTPRLVHAANSAGAMRLARARHDIVRVGIGLLGYVEPPAGDALTPVLRLVTQVLSVHEADAGETVGYGRTATLESPRKIALVAIGYNDGYPRALSNRGWMAIDGVRCPVIGRVCMDVTMVDASDVPNVGVGTEVVVYGTGPGEPGVLEHARLAETIPYELLTRISSRVRRIFTTSQR